MSDTPKTVKVEEFCDFLNDDATWEGYYFDDIDSDYHEGHITFDGKLYAPTKPGEDLDLDALDGTVYWQGKGEIPAHHPPDSVKDFFLEWRDKRDFVYITVKTSRDYEKMVRITLNLLREERPEYILEVKG